MFGAVYIQILLVISFHIDIDRAKGLTDFHIFCRLLMKLTELLATVRVLLMSF